MHMNAQTPIGVAITLLRKEIDERKTALSILEALVAQGVTALPAVANGAGPASRGGRRRGGRGGKQTVGQAAVAIMRAAGRPLHGLREIIPALEAQGYKISHRAGLATTLLRTGEVVRTSPGTFAVKGGAAS